MTPFRKRRSNTGLGVGGGPLGTNAIARTSCDSSMMSCRRVSRVRKKLALTRKLEETAGTPCWPPHPHEVGFWEHTALTAWYVNPVLQVPGGLASPWVVMLAIGVQLAVPPPW